MDRCLRSRGMVLTTVKENPLVEVAIRSPIPSDTVNSTILAAWTYGLGRTAVVTTDAGHRWASAWTQWENYDKFYSQLIRWAMRPSSDRGKYSVSADARDGKVRVVITALDANDEFRNSLRMTGAAVGPDLQPFDFKIRQLAPGRYVGEFEASKTGSYHLTVVPAAGEAPILTGVNVPYSAEFRDHDTNVGLLQQLAALQPTGGQAGVLSSTDLDAPQMEQLLTLDAFRPDLPKAVSIRDVWPAVAPGRQLGVPGRCVCPTRHGRPSTGFCRRCTGCGARSQVAASWRKWSSDWSVCGARSRKWPTASISVGRPRDSRPRPTIMSVPTATGDVEAAIGGLPIARPLALVTTPAVHNAHDT